MANYNNLKATINANIKANGNEEITGPILNTVLNQAVTTLGDGWSYKGIATPSMSPGTPDSNVFYIATTAGTYTNFGSLVVAEGEVAILKYNGSWAKEVTGAATAAQVTQLGQEVDENQRYIIDGINSGFPNNFTIPSSDAIGGYYMAASADGGVGTFVANAINYHFIVPVSQYKGYKISLDHASQYGFVKEYEPGVSITYCAGCNRVSGKPTEQTIPNDCEYLYIYVATDTSAISATLIGFPTTNLEDLDGRVTTLEGTVDSINEEFAPIGKKLTPLLDTFDLLHPYAIFNGINSAASITQVDLTSDGDFLEMELFPDASIVSPNAYGLVNWSTNQISVGASQTNIWVRGNDSSRTWVASGVSIGGTKAHYILKVLFDENKIKIYVDGTLIHTYNGQVPISLKYWGLYSSGSSYYWKGKIGYINVNGNVGYITNLTGYNGNIKLETDFGFLTEEQAARLDQSGAYPNIIVSAASSSVNVYNKVHDNIYVNFTINHQVDLSTGQLKYKDLWRIASRGGLFTYNGSSFTSLGVNLLVAAENEFAIKFAGFLDFTGGYHGYERIDTDASCYVVFCLDGKEYSIAELVALGTCSGDSFEYRQKAFCYTDSGYSASPVHFANHVKRTRFENGGFVTRNYFEVILDDLSVSSLTAESAFEGLVCVSEDCANKVVGVDGTIYPTTHPATSVILVNNINKTSRFVKMFNGAVSCCLDAKMIGTSVSGYATPGNRVQIMDRADDTKYYAYLPSNVAWGDGDAMEVECVVKYDYRQ